MMTVECKIFSINESQNPFLIRHLHGTLSPGTDPECRDWKLKDKKLKVEMTRKNVSAELHDDRP